MRARKRSYVTILTYTLFDQSGYLEMKQMMLINGAARGVWHAPEGVHIGTFKWQNMVHLLLATASSRLYHGRSFCTKRGRGHTPPPHPLPHPPPCREHAPLIAVSPPPPPPPPPSENSGS